MRSTGCWEEILGRKYQSKKHKQTSLSLSKETSTFIHFEAFMLANLIIAIANLAGIRGSI